MLLTIVIPAYNEERRIGETLEKFLRFFHGRPVEFLIVLNGCRDNTAGIVKSFVARYPHAVSYLEIPLPSKGAAILKGFSQARGDLIGFLDADGSTSPEQFQKLIDHMPEYDGAIASRWKKGSEVINRNFLRKAASLGFIMVVRSLFWMPFIDTQCGAKVFTRRLVLSLLPRLTVTNMAFDVELLYRARQRQFRIAEVPSRWVDKSSSALLGSPLKFFRSSVYMFFTLLRIRFKA